MKYIIIFLLIFNTISFAKDICLTEQQFDKITKQLEEDKKALQEDDAKWKQVRKETPEIVYKVEKENVVIEKIKITVKDDNPLEYTNTFTVTQSKEGWFPFKLRLIGSVEFGSSYFSPDVKIGLKFFSLSPINMLVFRNLGLNAFAGIKSFGAGLSYDLPAPFKNTSIIGYSGFTYTLKSIYGVGMALNF